MQGKGEKRHDTRKSPGSAEQWRKYKHIRNATRGKQVWVTGQGWTRITGE